MTPLLSRLCLASMLAAIALSPAQAAEPYLGRCANSASNTDDVPIAITARAIATYCRVLSVPRQGGAASSWRIHTSGRGEAKAKGYEGEMCGECGNFTLVRNGTCMKCDTCGSTTGCS
jgi:hypothetical protein